MPWASTIALNVKQFQISMLSAMTSTHEILVTYMAQSCIALVQEHCSCFTFMPKTSVN